MSNLSDLWQQIKSTYLIEKIDLENFRQPGTLNSRLSSWEPRELSLRWYKSFLTLAVNSASNKILSIYAGIRNPNIGNPLVVADQSGRLFNLDFLLAAQEIEFLEDTLVEGGVLRICEIGAGFGRTCQAIFNTYPEIVSYTIIDFPEMLIFQEEYLKLALKPEDFIKIQFLDCNSIEMTEYDMVIQIDGFQEMDESTIERYYSFYCNTAKYIFIKNPIGKYNPTTAGLENISPELIPFALGRSRNIIDIWNISEIEEQLTAHHENYKPISHTLVKYEKDRLFPHVILQLFSKNQQ